MEEEKRNPSYYAILPASVRYDTRLAPMERILYAEITALAQANGVCWAKNAYFQRLYDVSEGTVRRWVSHLQKFGYITVELVSKNNIISGRKIRLCETLPPSAQKCADGTKMSAAPSAQKCADKNNTRVINNNTPLPPQGDASEDAKGFEKFWAAYPRKVAKKPALRAWQKAKPDDKKLAAILDGLEKWKQCPNWVKDDGAFVPYPAKFLNQEYWMSPPTTQKEEAPLMPEGFQLIPNERGEMQWVQI